MPKFTVEEIKEAAGKAERLRLHGWELFAEVGYETAAEVCNGVGAEWMPEWSRALLDKRFPVLKVAVMLHDLGYYMGRHSDDDFRQVNDDLEYNGKILAFDAYGWYNPLRYLVWNDAHRLSRVVQLCGKKAYLQAIAEREWKKTQERA